MFERRFMRFELSGYLSILYWFFFMACFFHFPSETIKTINIYHIGVAAAAGLVAAPPIGFLLHQLDISIFCPFRKRFGLARKAVVQIEEWNKSIGAIISDNKMQSIIVAAKTNPKSENYKHYEYLQSEIDKRYSYYYGRWEASVLSPVFGLLLMFFTSVVYYLNKKEWLISFASSSRNWFMLLVLLLIVTIGYFVAKYCKELYREIIDLELIVVKQNEGYVKDVLASIKEVGQ
jgi:hypothetical protein